MGPRIPDILGCYACYSVISYRWVTSCYGGSYMPLVSKSEAARLVGVTRQTIHRKVKAGELSATGGEIDTSELIRVFGAISDGTQPVTGTSQPDSAVQTTLQARVDGLESQLAVTREQLADTAKDRDEWRDIAKEATSNVKLITNQGGGDKNNDNLMAFAAVAFVVGIGLTYMMLRNDVTPSDAMPLPAPVETQAAKPNPFEGIIFHDDTAPVETQTDKPNPFEGINFYDDPAPVETQSEEQGS